MDKFHPRYQSLGQRLPQTQLKEVGEGLCEWKFIPPSQRGTSERKSSLTSSVDPVWLPVKFQHPPLQNEDLTLRFTWNCWDPKGQRETKLESALSHSETAHFPIPMLTVMPQSRGQWASPGQTHRVKEENWYAELSQEPLVSTEKVQSFQQMGVGVVNTHKQKTLYPHTHSWKSSPASKSNSN